MLLSINFWAWSDEAIRADGLAQLRTAVGTPPQWTPDLAALTSFLIESTLDVPGVVRSSEPPSLPVLLADTNPATVCPIQSEMVVTALQEIYSAIIAGMDPIGTSDAVVTADSTSTATATVRSSSNVDDAMDVDENPTPEQLLAPVQAQMEHARAMLLHLMDVLNVLDADFRAAPAPLELSAFSGVNAEDDWTDKRYATTERFAQVAKFILHAKWLPVSLSMQHLSLDIMSASKLLFRGRSSRAYYQRAQAALHVLPLSGLAMDNPGAIARLMTAISHAALAPWPPASCDGDSTRIEQEIDAVWARIKAIMVAQSIASFRVVELLLRGMAHRIASHWELFSGLLARTQYPQLGDVVVRVMQMTLEPPPGSSAKPLETVDDLDRCEEVAVLDGQIDRLDHRARQYRQDLSQLVGELGPDAPLRAREDHAAAQRYMDLALANAAPMTRKLHMAVAVLVRRGLVALAPILARFPLPALPDNTEWDTVLAPAILDARATQLQAITDEELSVGHHVATWELMRPVVRGGYGPPAPSTASISAAAPALGGALEPELMGGKSQPDPAAQEQPSASPVEHPMSAKARRTAIYLAGFFTALLAVGNVDNALRGMAMYPQIDWVQVFPPIAMQLLRIADVALGADDGASAPAHLLAVTRTRVLLGRQRFFYPTWTADTVPRNDVAFAIRILERVPQMLYLRLSVAQRLAMLCKSSPQSLVAAGTSFMAVLKRYLLPAQMLSVTPPYAFSQLIWDLLRARPWTERYALYASMRSDVYQHGPLLPAMLTHIEFTTNYWLRRLSKDNARLLMRKFGKLLQGNPVPVLQLMVTKTMQYENIVGPVTEVLKNIGPGAGDVLMYSLLAAFSDPEGQASIPVAARQHGSLLLVGLPIGYGLKFDGIFLDGWATNLTSLVASLALQYSSTIDMTPLFAFLDRGPSAVTEEGSNDGAVGTKARFGLLETHILSSLVRAMTGIPDNREVRLQEAHVLEAATCVAQRRLTLAIDAATAPTAVGPLAVTTSTGVAKTEDAMARGRARATRVLIEQFRDRDRAATFHAHLLGLYTTLAERTRDWADDAMLERITPSDLMAEMQWKDRLRAIIVQYRVFLRSHLGDVPGLADRLHLDDVQWPLRHFLRPDPALPVNTESLYWRYRLYHIHFDANLYVGPSEVAARDKHRTAHEAAVAEISQMLAAFDKALSSFQSTAPIASDLVPDVPMDDGGNDEDAPSARPATPPNPTGSETLQAAAANLPTAMDLVLRAAASHADAEYASYWVERLPRANQSVLMDVVGHVWAIRGMTEDESANLGILLARTLAVLHKAADARPGADVVAGIAAGAVVAVHEGMYKFFWSALGLSKSSNEEDNGLDSDPVAPTDQYLLSNALTLLLQLNDARVFPVLSAQRTSLWEAVANLAKPGANVSVKLRTAIGALRASDLDPELSARLDPKKPAPAIATTTLRSSSRTGTRSASSSLLAKISTELANGGSSGASRNNGAQETGRPRTANSTVEDGELTRSVVTSPTRPTATAVAVAATTAAAVAAGPPPRSATPLFGFGSASVTAATPPRPVPQPLPPAPARSPTASSSLASRLAIGVPPRPDIPSTGVKRSRSSDSTSRRARSSQRSPPSSSAGTPGRRDAESRLDRDRSAVLDRSVAASSGSTRRSRSRDSRGDSSSRARDRSRDRRSSRARSRSPELLVFSLSSTASSRGDRDAGGSSSRSALVRPRQASLSPPRSSSSSRRDTDEPAAKRLKRASDHSLAVSLIPAVASKTSERGASGDGSSSSLRSRKYSTGNASLPQRPESGPYSGRGGGDSSRSGSGGGGSGGSNSRRYEDERGGGGSGSGLSSSSRYSGSGSGGGGGRRR